MSDEEFRNELNELIQMLQNLREIKDRGFRRRFKVEIKFQLKKVMKD